MISAAPASFTSPTEEDARKQLPFAVHTTNFSWLGSKYEGKVRDCYIRGTERFLVAKDTLSCFDYVLCTIPWKGEVLTKVASYWFEKTKHIVANHVISNPDPNVVRARECKMIPVEVVVRGYLVGSSLRDYQAGRLVSGVSLPPGLRPHQQLPEPILTPSTKAPIGEHDEPISEEDIVRTGRVDAALWKKVRETALALFYYGSEDAAKKGILLADTKYEFGIVDGELHLADEIHTPDSSRMWDAGTYTEKFETGQRPLMLDKEPVRLWLTETLKFKNGDPLPVIPDEYRAAVALHYIHACRRITGENFFPRNGDILEQMGKTLRTEI